MKQKDIKHFQKHPFTKEQCDKFLRNALRDLDIARKDAIPEVRFTYAYQALFKAGIALLAKRESLKVRSVPGHHAAVISQMSVILEDENIHIYGHRMRDKRNRDLYDGGDIISAQEAKECLDFVEKAIKRVMILLK